MVFYSHQRGNAPQVGSQIKNESEDFNMFTSLDLLVVLFMALAATALVDGALVRNVILFSVLIYELVGPAMTKRSLLAGIL